MRERWKVVGGEGKGGILVREGKELDSPEAGSRLATGALVEQEELVGQRLRYTKVEGGGPATGWVSCRLARRPLLMRLAAGPQAYQPAAGGAAPPGSGEQQPPEAGEVLPPTPATSSASSPAPPPPQPAAVPVPAAGAAPGELLLNADHRGTLRGPCKTCEGCTTWQLDGHSDIRWRACASDGPGRGLGTGGPAQRCRLCGCLAEEHADLSRWQSEVLGTMRSCRDPALTGRLLPGSSKLPAAARAWDRTDVALFVLTDGRYDPRREQRPRGQPGVLSVCVPTSTRRHHFHPLLYRSFSSQTLQGIELVVVDTGPTPSALLQEKAKQDERVVYRHFPVQDAKSDRQRAILRMAGKGTAKPVMYEAPPNSWSLGLKRNVAVALASGAVIAHFDDDDLYAPNYLEAMLAALRRKAAESQSGDPAELQQADLDRMAAIVTLSEWHLFDFSSRTFRHMDPNTDPNVLDSWRKPMLYGYGFSYVYTRAAWLRQPFPDREDCEDDHFISRLRDRALVPVGLVPLPSPDVAMVAHSYHGDNTGVSEFNGAKRLGTPCPAVPEGFRGLLPIVEEVAKCMPPRRPEPPPPPLLWLSSSGSRQPGKGWGKGMPFPRKPHPAAHPVAASARRFAL